MGEPTLGYSAPPGREGELLLLVAKSCQSTPLAQCIVTLQRNFWPDTKHDCDGRNRKSARPPINMMAGVHWRIVQFCAENNKRESKGAPATAPGDKVKCLWDEHISQIFILIQDESQPHPPLFILTLWRVVWLTM